MRYVPTPQAQSPEYSIPPLRANKTQTELKPSANTQTRSLLRLEAPESSGNKRIKRERGNYASTNTNQSSSAVSSATSEVSGCLSGNLLPLANYNTVGSRRENGMCQVIAGRANVYTRHSKAAVHTAHVILLRWASSKVLPQARQLTQECNTYHIHLVSNYSKYSLFLPWLSDGCGFE